LYDWHRRAGAKFIEFGGWEMPLQYTSILEEHAAVRQAAGLFDVSHMGKLLIQGTSAHAFLDRLSANRVPALPGQARYTFLLREDGTILDDVIVTCLAGDRYLLVCNAGPRPAVLAWLDAHRPGDVRLRDLTGTHACLALQGPRALEVLQRLTPTNLAGIPPFRAALLPLQPVSKAGIPPEMEGWGSPAEDPLLGAALAGLGAPVSDGPFLLATRTGYTGEAGFELFPPAAVAAPLWEALLGSGAELGLRPVGLGARDTLRLEKGYLLSGQDFDGRQTPLEVGAAWVVKWDRPFLGREALLAQRARDDYRRLVGLRMEDRGIPRPGCRVLAAGRAVGVVTSGTLSPSLRIGIALASVEKAQAAPGTSVEVEIRGSLHPARVVRPPFV